LLLARTLLLALVCLGITLSTPALAEPSAADRATARALAREGFEALENDDFATAEDRFRRADELVHAPTLVVDHARALVGLGRLVEAHERYSLVLREGVSPNAAWPWKRAYADAQKEIEIIKQRLAWLTIQVQGPEQPLVTVDGKEIPLAAIGVRRATDPGERLIRATAPGFYPKEETVTLAEGEERSIELALEPMPEEPEPVAPATDPEPVAETRVVDQAPTTDNTLAYVALGVGGAGLLTWGITGALFLKDYSTLKDECVNNGCPSSSKSTDDRYETLGLVSGIAFGVGLAGAAAGITLLIMNDSDAETSAAASRKQSDAVRVAPYFAGNSAGITGQF